jgi:hypothetical protein
LNGLDEVKTTQNVSNSQGKFSTIPTFDNVIPTDCKLATFPAHKEHLQQKMLHISQQI